MVIRLFAVNLLISNSTRVHSCKGGYSAFLSDLPSSNNQCLLMVIRLFAVNLLISNITRVHSCKVRYSAFLSELPRALTTNAYTQTFLSIWWLLHECIP